MSQMLAKCQRKQNIKTTSNKTTMAKCPLKPKVAKGKLQNKGWIKAKSRTVAESFRIKQKWSQQANKVFEGVRAVHFLKRHKNYIKSKHRLIDLNRTTYAKVLYCKTCAEK